MLISRHAIAAALAATTSDDTRYHLDGIHVRPDGTIESTNGHLAIVATQAERTPDEDFPTVPGAEYHGDPERDFLIPSDLAKRLIAGMPKKATIPALQHVQTSRNGSPSTVTLAATDLQAPIVSTITIDETSTFPAIDRVMPAADKPGTVAIALGVPVLEAILKATKAAYAGSKGQQYVTMHIPTRKGDRFLTKAEDGSEVLGDVRGAVRCEVSGVDGLTLAIVAMPFNRKK